MLVTNLYVLRGTNDSTTCYTPLPVTGDIIQHVTVTNHYVLRGTHDSTTCYTPLPVTGDIIQHVSYKPLRVTGHK